VALLAVNLCVAVQSIPVCFAETPRKEAAHHLKTETPAQDPGAICGKEDRFEAKAELPGNEFSSLALVRRRQNEHLPKIAVIATLTPERGGKLTASELVDRPTPMNEDEHLLITSDDRASRDIRCRRSAYAGVSFAGSSKTLRIAFAQ